MQGQINKKGFKTLLKEAILPKVETISIFLIAISLGIKFMNVTAYHNLIMIALTALAIVNYLNAFIFVNKDSSWLEKITVQPGYISCAVSLIGLLFHILKLRGGNEMLTIGLTILGLATAYVLLKTLSNKSVLHKNLFIKFGGVFVFVILGYTFL